MSETEVLSPSAKQADHVPLSDQVGGHKGVMTTKDGTRLIKPALPTEVDFYESVNTDPALAPLKPFISKFYGTQQLEGNKDMFLSFLLTLFLLENLSHAFLRPNILDIKLGTVLYDENAMPEKRAWMEKTARETTSLETGIRLTGFQVSDFEAGVVITTSREYGKSLKPSDLDQGISLFFPIASANTPARSASSLSGSRALTVTPSRIRSDTGLPPRIMLPILESLKKEIKEIRDAIAQAEIRMVGGSLLIIYEADWVKAEEGLKLSSDQQELDKTRIGLPYVVKLIDFAHTRIAVGEGPDLGVLKGIDTTLGLLDRRIEQVKIALL